MTERRLCRAEDIAEGQGRGFRFGEGIEQVALFVIRRGGALVAYVNACPHLGTPLDFLPDDLPLNSHPAAVRASAVDTPFGAV